jgi:hypothetical protein
MEHRTLNFTEIGYAVLLAWFQYVGLLLQAQWWARCTAHDMHRWVPKKKDAG